MCDMTMSVSALWSFENIHKQISIKSQMYVCAEISFLEFTSEVHDILGTFHEISGKFGQNIVETRDGNFSINQ